MPCRRGPLFSSSSVCVTGVGCCLPACSGKSFSPSESAKFDASACLLGTLSVTCFVGARLLGTVCVTGVGGCLPGFSWTVGLSKLKRRNWHIGVLAWHRGCHKCSVLLARLSWTIVFIDAKLAFADPKGSLNTSLAVLLGIYSSFWRARFHWTTSKSHISTALFSWTRSFRTLLGACCP